MGRAETLSLSFLAQPACAGGGGTATSFAMDQSAIDSARRREPLFNLPLSVTVSIGALLLIHAWRSLGLSGETDLRVLLEFAFVPARWTLWWDPTNAGEVLSQASLGEGSAARAALARLIVAQAEADPWTILSYAALHGSWGHVLLNSVWLAAFGAPVARRCGGLRYAALAACCAASGALTHLVLHPFGVAPLIGASAAVSGLMAASARFIFTSSQGDGMSPRRAALSLPELLTDRRTLAFLAIWLVTNFLFGAVAMPLGVVDATVAWQAHVGGFAAGLFFFPLFDHPDARAAAPR